MIPIKIAHISDIHQGLAYPGPSPFSRFEDINRILDWTADKIIAEQVDLVLLAGDLFKDAKVMLDRASQEIASIVRFLRKLSSAGIEIIAISGTPSHDAVSAYELINEMNIPKVRIATNSIFNVLPDYDNMQIACLPGLNRSSLLTNDEMKGLPTEQIHRIMTDKITQMCIGMSTQMPNDKPKILMAHMTYQGADKGFEDLLMQHEPILTKEAVAGFDLVCLGHIHKPQIIDNKVFYSGPIERLSFNEEDITPGFWIHEILTDMSYDNIESHFTETPARPYKTLKWGEGALNNYIDGKYIRENLQNAIVRLHYSCSEELHKQINRKALEQALYDAGAFFVTEIKADIERVDRARDSEVTENLTPLQALEKWAINQEYPEQEINVLKVMAAELMESGV